MGAAQPEIHQDLAGRGEHAARRLGRNQRFKVNQVDEARFHKLGLRHGSDHAQDGLVGKENRAFRHRVHFAGKAQRLEMPDEIGGKEAAFGDPLQFLGTKAQPLQVFDRLFQSRRHHEVAVGRELPDEEFEHGGLAHAAHVVGVQHGELVEIGEER